MGPKAKKKKLSKAERLRLLREEEERRLKEEEEARLKFEKEEQERQEIKRIENEKWQRLEEKDLERRNEELEELNLLEECFLEAEKLKRETRVLAQWKHYIKCDGSPDPSVAQEINTFISLWEEETKETFEEVVEKSKLVLSLIEKLKLILLETLPCDLEEETITQHQGSILRLQELLHLKFSVATELLLRQASTLADLDSGNMERVIRDENLTLYVWANLKKNPRYRSVKFSGTQVGFEIPRILATSNIALRLLHTRYDHVSPLCPVTVEPVEHSRLVAEHLRVSNTIDKAIVKATEKASEAENTVTIVIDTPEDLEDQGGSKEEEQSLSQEDIINVDLQDTHAYKTSVHEDEDESEAKAIKHISELTLLSEAVSTVQLSLVENTGEKPKIPEESAVDLYQFSTVGGVYHLDALELPPQCKPARGWIIVEILKEGLQKFIYPPETHEEPDSEGGFPPIEVTLEVCKDIAFFEDPKVVRWDAEGKIWRKDGISEVVYIPEERLIKFKLESFGPLTLIQDTHVNMPYESWELRPLSVNTVLLTVTSVFTEIQIHITGHLCMLASVKLKDQEHLPKLEGKWMAPIHFILALKEAGLNIFPTKYSHFYVAINQKVPTVEAKAYRQMALLSSACAFAWSKWNSFCNSTRVVFRVREHLAEEHQSHPWVLLMFSGDRAQALRIREDSEAFSEALKEDTEFHSTLYHMVKDFVSLEAIDRIRQPDKQVVDSVCYLLLSTRLLSYS